MRPFTFFVVLAFMKVTLTGCHSLNGYLATKNPQNGAHIELDKCSDLEHRLDDPLSIEGKFLDYPSLHSPDLSRNRSPNPLANPSEQESANGDNPAYEPWTSGSFD